MPDPTIRLRVRVRGVFTERFELQMMPFDSQELTVRLRSSFARHSVVFSWELPVRGRDQLPANARLV